MNVVNVISKYQQHIQIEIDDLKKNGSRKFKVFSGILEKEMDGRYYYRFECDTELNLAEGYPIHIELSSSNIDGVIQKIEGIFIWLMCKHNLGREVSNVKISCDAWALLEALNERLEECKDEPNYILTKLIEEGAGYSYEQQDIPKRGDLYKFLYEDDISFIWGPPGTGKTTTLAKTAIDYYHQGKKVLIVSHSNVSVDQSILKIVSELKVRKEEEVLKRGEIMRYGFLKTDEIKEEAFVTQDGIIDFKYSSVKELYKQTLAYKEKEKLTKAEERELKALEKTLKSERFKYQDQVLSEAKIVATTISKIAVDDNFVSGRLQFDVVIFDEASMAYVPQVFYACSLANERFLCFGDFMQLAPISQCEDATLLKEDIYTFLGITNGEGDVLYHPWLVMLDDQFRTHPDIVRFVNKKVYKGLIKNPYELLNNKRLFEITESVPFSNNPLVMLDLSDFYAPAHRTETSRINIFYALIAFLIALEAEKQGHCSVGIITPYAAQAKLIRRMIMDYRKDNKECNISCSTIHQFQGSERDVIIFDTLESYPRSRPGRLTSSNENNALNRLVNVAVTRSRGKLIVLANKTFWDMPVVQKNAIKDLIRFIHKEGYVLNGDDVLNYLRFKNYGKIRTYFNSEEAIYDYSMDVRSIKKELLLSCPNGTIDNEIWEKELIKKVTSVENPPELFIKRNREPNNKISGYGDFAQIDENTDYPLTILDNKVTWYDMPKFNKKYYRKRNKSTYVAKDVVFRIDGSYTSDVIKSMSDVTKIDYLGNLLDYKHVSKIKSSKIKKYVEDNYKCSTCGKPLTLAYKNNFYCKCINGNHNEFLSMWMVESFINKYEMKCPKCGEDLIVNIGHKGLYIICRNKHLVDILDLKGADEHSNIDLFELSILKGTKVDTLINIKTDKRAAVLQYSTRTHKKSYIEDLNNLNILKEIAMLDIYKWKDEYRTFEGILDDFEWQIRYKEKDREEKIISGCNLYPEQWNYLIDKLEKLNLKINISNLRNKELYNISYNEEDDFFIDYYLD